MRTLFALPLVAAGLLIGPQIGVAQSIIEPTETAGSSSASDIQPSSSAAESLLTADAVVAGLGDGSLRNPNEIEEQWRLGQQSKQVAIGSSSRGDAFEDWRKGLNENGLLLELSFTHIVQGASSTITTEDTASGYELLLSGTWTPVGFGTDSPLTFGFEGFLLQELGTDIPPIMLGGNIGSLWPTAVALDDSGFTLGQVWVQKKFNAKFGFRVGRIFAISAYDFHPLKNWRTDFADGVNSATLVMPVPAAIGFGGFGTYRPTPNSYIRLGFHDANAESQVSPTDTWNGETFKILEVGFDPGLAERQQGAPPPGDIHMSFWQQDAREDFGIEEGWGATLMASQRFGDWLPFMRLGYSDGGANGPAVLSELVSFGFAKDNILPNNSDRLGMSFSWGQAADTNLDPQKTFDIYYRYQLTNRIAISPLVQYIVDPVSNDEDIFVAGFRTRFVF